MRLPIAAVVCFILTILTVNDLLIADSGALADAKPSPTSLHLRTGVVPLDPQFSLHKSQVGAAPRSRHCVLQIDGPMTPQRAARLARAGIKLGQYLPMYAYLVNLPKDFIPSTALARLEFVRFVGPY